MTANILSVSPRPFSNDVLVSEKHLNSHQSLRAEVTALRGRSVVRISRWKLTAAGPQRTGRVFEFGAHRTADVAKMISDVQRYLGQIEGRS